METLGIYVQVPFCASKCSFCNFSSRVAPSTAFDRYCGALITEIERLPVFYRGHGIGQRVLTLPVDTLYVGGGTPSLLGPERLKQLIEVLRRNFQLVASAEFTMEVAPGSADRTLLENLRLLGVNRLSIGAQSFNDRELRSVGRLQSAAETQERVREARRAGFENISLDLIVGLPHQTRDSWLHTLEGAMVLAPEHVSIYLFEIDEKSRLGREVLAAGTRYDADAVPDEDFMADAYEHAREILARAGYGQYEISNFALPGYESRHNQRYWQLKPYVGLGAGAHSLDGERRWANEEVVEAYEERLACSRSPIAEVRTLSPEERLEEFFFLGLRQRQGVDLATAAERWERRQVARVEARVERLARDGWLERVGSRVRLSDRALLISNEIFQEFLA